jgi:hypothetical protein
VAHPGAKPVAPVTAPQWLDRDALALHISVRVDELPRLTRAGELPTPSFLLGPRTPRWWSADVDALLSRGAPGAGQDPSPKVQALIQAILDGRIGRGIRRPCAEEACRTAWRFRSPSVARNRSTRPRHSPMRNRAEG